MDEIKPLHLYLATDGPENPVTCCSVIRIAMFSPGVNTKDKESLGSDVNSG